VGRFVTKDPWTADASEPLTLNRYVYAGDNPVNYTDPSGLQGPDVHGTGGKWREQVGWEPVLFEGREGDWRDLTQWLVEELRTNASRPETGEIRDLLWTPHRNFWLAKDKWFDLVAAHHTWDFKDAIYSKLGTNYIILRHPGEVYGWYWYDVPGNINFGYVGRAAGWSGLLLHLGAGYAQVKAPGENGCLIPRNPRWPCTDDERCLKKGGEVKAEWTATAFDSPEDYLAVEFGIQLYEAHPVNLTVDQFSHFLSTHARMLKSYDNPNPDQEPPNDALREDWPYEWGYFNGPLGPRFSG
jgi:hypothetical protein